MTRKLPNRHPMEGPSVLLAGTRDTLSPRFRREIERNYASLLHHREMETRKILNPGFARESTDWQQDAACKDVSDPEIFFPMDHNEFKITSPWVEYCMACPVRAACGQFADDRGLVGIWGGVFKTGNMFSAGLRGRPRRKGTPMDSQAVSVAVRAS